MMWIIIIGLISLTFIKFFWDLNKKGRENQKLGGMSKKYEKLVNLFLTNYPGYQILEENKTDIIIGSKNSYGIHWFGIMDSFRSIVIKMVFRNSIFGNFELEWEFDPNDDPEYILFKINKDSNEYLENANQLKKADKKFEKTLSKVMRKYYF